MNERIAYHRKGGKIFDRIVYLPIPQSVLDLVESAFINILKPKYNLTAKGHHGVPIRLPEEKYAWIISQLLSPNITQPSFLEK